MDFEKVPSGHFQAKCNKCGSSFPFSKNAGLNCTLTSQTGVTRVGKESDSDQMESMDEALSQRKEAEDWVVDHPVCAGNRYTLEKIGRLIHANFISGSTMVLPPGAPRYYEAKLIPDLKPFFQERNKQRRLAREKEEALKRQREDSGR